MKTKVVPASELSTKTLAAEDYIMKPYRVTYCEEIRREATVMMATDTEREAKVMIRTEAEAGTLVDMLKKGKNKTKVKSMVCVVQVERIDEDT